MCLLPILGQSLLTPNRDYSVADLRLSVVPSDTMLRKGHAFVTALIIIIILYYISVSVNVKNNRCKNHRLEIQLGIF